MPRSRTAWKNLERATAKAVGGRRNPASAGVGGADVSAPGWLCECKYRASFAVDSLYRGERSKRQKELARGQRFALVIRAQGRSPLAVIALADFQALAGLGDGAPASGDEAVTDPQTRPQEGAQYVLFTEEGKEPAQP